MQTLPLGKKQDKTLKGVGTWIELGKALSKTANIKKQ
jgi:hypothetical protein